MGRRLGWACSSCRDFSLQVFHKLAFLPWVTIYFYIDHSPGSFCDVTLNFTMSESQKLGGSHALFLTMLFDHETFWKKISEPLTLSRIKIFKKFFSISPSPQNNP